MKQIIWRRIPTISAFLASVLIPIALAYIGNAYARAIKEREVQERFVEIAVEILKTPPAKDTSALRDWAIDIVNKYSGVPLSMEAKEELRNSSTLPLSNTRAHTTTITDIPAEQVESVIKQFEDSGAKNVSKQKQADGHFTVTALFQ